MSVEVGAADVETWVYASQLRATDLGGRITFTVTPDAKVTDLLVEVVHEGLGANKKTFVRLATIVPPTRAGWNTPLPLLRQGMFQLTPLTKVEVVQR